MGSTEQLTNTAKCRGWSKLFFFHLLKAHQKPKKKRGSKVHSFRKCPPPISCPYTKQKPIPVATRSRKRKSYDAKKRRVTGTFKRGQTRSVCKKGNGNVKSDWRWVLHKHRTSQKTGEKKGREKKKRGGTSKRGNQPPQKK